nr:MAG TPA: Integrase [Caudoviricetes sp.]
MLIKCPECDLPVSDKAIICPHCGCPLTSQSPRLRKQKRRRKLPNGFGQITEIKNRNLRKPFRAMVTIGVNENGRPIQKMLKPDSYFETYNEAYSALVAYNKNPYDLDSTILVSELYEKWLIEYSKTIESASSLRSISAAWKRCSSVYNMRATDLRARHIKGCIDITPSASLKGRIKSVFNLMLDYALEYEIVDKNYARTFTLANDNPDVNGHIIFTDKEMDKILENIHLPYADLIIIQCYSGWRPQELGLIKVEDVDIINWTFRGGMKTEAGKNRIVPIHSKIRSLVKARYDEAISLNSEYLFNCTDTATHRSNLKLTYDKYRHRFDKIRDQLELNPEHRAHDGRKHFITLCKKYNVDEYAIKYMVGHTISDITEKVYTDRSIDWLKTEIEKIK